MLEASGSVPLRHSQPDFFLAGWCIGHSALPVWMQVQVTASAACGAWAKSDTGVPASSDSWQQSHPHAIHERRRRRTFTPSNVTRLV